MKSLRDSISLVWSQPSDAIPYYTLDAQFTVGQRVKLDKEYVKFGHGDILKHTEDEIRDRIVKHIFGQGLYHLARLESLSLRMNAELMSLGRGVEQKQIQEIGTELREILRGNGAV